MEKEEDRAKIAALPMLEIDESRLSSPEPRVRVHPGACIVAANTAQAFVGRAVEAAEQHADWDGPTVFGKRPR